jgi:alpha-N-arabinofuranosidase
MLKTNLIAAALLALAPAVRAADDLDTSTWVRFSAFRYTGKTAVTPKEGEYLNPVVAGFYTDPSVCRVGNDYYLVNSALNYFPGIPIWHSKDLVNWVQIGNVLDRPSQFAIEHGRAISADTDAPTRDEDGIGRPGMVYAGTDAPTIRYHDGTFYVVCKFMGGVGSFYVTAKDPKGPWSEPVQLGVRGIHPSFFFDDDGKCYFTKCGDPVGGAHYLGHYTIRLQEVDLDQKRPVGEMTVIVDGGTSGRAAWCEGPHLYKINKTYYLVCAQGGAWNTHHSVVIFKSGSLRGPYTPWEKNPILTAADLEDNRPNPVTCTGHADLVTSIALKIEGGGPVTKCFYKAGSGEFAQLGGDLASSFLGVDRGGQGVTLGMFAHEASARSVR